MKTITFNIPEVIDINENDLVYSLATSLYAQELLSIGQAAAMVGVSKQVFMKNMGKYGISLFSTRLEDLHNDFENA